MTTWDDIRHFTPGEFACKCGECGSDGTEMQLDFVFKLDDLRARLAVPFVITSGYRCPDYNDKIASTGRDGPHTTGRAADIGMSGTSVYRLVQAATVNGMMTGIGLHQRGPHKGRFVHLDDLGHPHPRARIWTY